MKQQTIQFPGKRLNMDFNFTSEIPCINLTIDHRNFVEGSDGWKRICNAVRNAAEDYGCFQVAYDKISPELCDNMFKSAGELFDLPKETKEKNISASNPYYGYTGNVERIPLFETMGFGDALSLESAQAFTDLMWPKGNPAFCNTINSFGSKLYGLGLLVLKMIMESYGVDKYYDSYVEGSDSVFRVIRYKAPQGNQSELGLTAHVDKSALTVLSYNSVRGLEMLLKTGEWIPVSPKDGVFTFFIGDALKAWSNGRLHTAKHKVVMSGDKTRYSFIAVSVPKDGTVVDAPKELIDDEHPRLFRAFKFMDFFRYYHSTNNEDDALEVYAGINAEM